MPKLTMKTVAYCFCLYWIGCVAVAEDVMVKRVLYLGESSHVGTNEGLQALQQPLTELYAADGGSIPEGSPATLTVLPSGLQLVLSDDDSGTIIWFPITSLTLCAAVRCINTINTSTGEKNATFVSLSSPEAGRANGKTPVIFTFITRESKGKDDLVCHAFVCNSARDALDLVELVNSSAGLENRK